MKCTKIILGGLMAVAATVNAMPTLEQTKKVEPLVMDLMREDQNALKSGKKTRAEVAESAMALAEKAETEAAKLLLMKGAFHLYVRAGEFDRAIETLQRLQSAIPDMPLDNMVRIIESSLRVVSRKNGGQLYRLLDETKTRIRYTNETASLEKSVKRTPSDRALRLKLAEHYAYLGKWDLALESFAATDGKAGTFAKSERDGKAATEKAADFWWNYPTGKADELVKCFRAHAVNLYEEAIASGDIKGLNKVQAERRIKEAKECEFVLVETRGISICDGDKIKVSGNQLKVKLPENETIEFVKVNPGKFPMLIDAKGNTKMVTITRPYWIGKYALTIGQWHALMGNILAGGEYDWRKDKTIDRQQAVMDKLGRDIAIARSVLQTSEFTSKLTVMLKDQIPQGYVVRLPTNAEWEYAVRGNKRDVYDKLIEFKVMSADYNTIAEKLNGGKDKMKVDQDKFKQSGLDCAYNYFVGRSINSRGIYDFFRAPEITLDRINNELIFDSRDEKSGREKGNAPCSKWPLPVGNVDPFQYLDIPEWHHTCVLKRGNWQTMMYLNCVWPQSTVRIVIGPDLVSEKLRKVKNN